MIESAGAIFKKHVKNNKLSNNQKNTAIVFSAYEAKIHISL